MKNRIAKYYRKRAKLNRQRGPSVSQIRNGELYAFDGRVWLANTDAYPCRSKGCECCGIMLHEFHDDESPTELQRRISEDPFIVLLHDGRIAWKCHSEPGMTKTEHWVAELTHIDSKDSP